MKGELVIESFEGSFPAADARELPPGVAAVAVNLDLSTKQGVLRGIKLKELNLPPYFELEDITLVPQKAPYADFDTIRIRLTNGPVYWETVDAAEVPVQPPNTEPYAAFDTIRLEYVPNLEPYFDTNLTGGLEDVTATKSAENTYPTITPDGDSRQIDDEAGLQTWTFTGEDAEGELSYFGIEFAPTGSHWRPLTLIIEGSNDGLSWSRLVRETTGNLFSGPMSYFNTASGWRYKRIYIEWDPLQPGPGSYVAALRATDVHGLQKQSGINVIVS